MHGKYVDSKIALPKKKRTSLFIVNINNGYVSFNLLLLILFIYISSPFILTECFHWLLPNPDLPSQPIIAIQHDWQMELLPNPQPFSRMVYIITSTMWCFLVLNHLPLWSSYPLNWIFTSFGCKTNLIDSICWFPWCKDCTMANFKLPTYHHWTQSWGRDAQQHTIV